MSRSNQSEAYQGRLFSFLRYLKVDVNIIRNVAGFLKDIWYSSPVKTVLSVLLKLLKGGVPVLNLYAGKLIIDEVVHLVHRSSQHQSLNYHLMFEYIALEMTAFLAYTILDRIGILIDTLIMEKYTNDCSIRLMNALAAADLNYLENSDVRDELEQVRRHINSKNILFPQLTAQLQNLVMAIIFSASLVFYTPWLVLMLTLSLFPSFLSELCFNAKSYKISKVFTPERRQQDYLRNLGIGDQALKEVRTFNLAPFLISRYNSISSAIYEKNRAISMKRSYWSMALSVLSSMAYYAAYFIVTIKTVKGQFTIGDLAFLTSSFRRVKFLLEGFVFSTSQMVAQAQHVSDVTRFLKSLSKAKVGATSIPVPSAIREGFRFERVGFRYSEFDKWSLRDVSFSFRPGDLIAIVGLNGAGKTTLMKLLTRLYRPTEGTIYLDGVPIENYDLEGFRKNVSVIFQDYMKYSFTVSENIGIGDLDRLDDLEKISEAAKKSSVDSMIDRLPAGYRQKLGKIDKTGVDLSGGQWQKLAVARAFMRDAPFIILDEPSTALDADSEEQMFNKIIDKKASTGIVFISHRLSTVRRADKIIVLEHGKITEMGTHQELLELEGTYSRLFKLQAAAYA